MDKNAQTLADQLFSWTGYDGDIEQMYFYNVVLKIPIGDIPAGTYFCGALINFIKSTLQLDTCSEVDEEENCHVTDMREVDLVLSVAGEVRKIPVEDD